MCVSMSLQRPAAPATGRKPLDPEVAPLTDTKDPRRGSRPGRSHYRRVRADRTMANPGRVTRKSGEGGEPGRRRNVARTVSWILSFRRWPVWGSELDLPEDADEAANWGSSSRRQASGWLPRSLPVICLQRPIAREPERRIIVVHPLDQDVIDPGILGLQRADPSMAAIRQSSRLSTVMMRARVVASSATADLAEGATGFDPDHSLGIVGGPRDDVPGRGGRPDCPELRMMTARIASGSFPSWSLAIKVSTASDFSSRMVVKARGSELAIGDVADVRVGIRADVAKEALGGRTDVGRTTGKGREDGGRQPCRQPETSGTPE